MEIKSMRFKANSEASLANVVLQGNLKNAKGKFVTKRAEAIKEIDDFEGTRDAGRRDPQQGDRQPRPVAGALRDQGTRARRHGAVGAGRRRGLPPGDEIARKHGVTKVTKSKSMLSEEAGLNQALKRRVSSRSRPTSASTSCRSTTTSRPRTSSRRPSTRPSRRSPTCSTRCTARRARPTPAADARGARGAARAFSHRRHGHLGRQLPGRRDRLGGAGHQRGQWPHGDHAAAWCTW
jgi:hypothetical protein